MIEDLTVDGLAVYRLARLYVDDHAGEYARLVTVDVGAALGVEDAARKLTECYWCSGWWIACAVAFGRRTRAWRALRIPLALSAIAGILGERV